MNKFTAELFFESPELSTDFSVKSIVGAADMWTALCVAKTLLKSGHPNLKYLKIWCWHIELHRRFHPTDLK